MRDFAGQPNIEVWHARLDVDDFLREQRRRRRQGAGEEDAGDRAQGPVARPPADGREDDGGRRRPAPVRLGPAAGAPRSSSCWATQGAASSPRRWGSWCAPTSRSLQPDRRHLLSQYRRGRHGPQGRRRRQRRDPRVDPAAGGRRRRRPPDPAGQGGPGVGARAVPGRQRVHAGRSACGRGAAAHAGRERRHARVAADPGHRRRRARLLRPAAARLEGVGGHRGDEARRRSSGTAACARGPWPARTPGPATASRSRRTWAARRRPTRRSRTSPSTYADRTERDHAALVQAIAAGRVEAVHGI